MESKKLQGFLDVQLTACHDDNTDLRNNRLLAKLTSGREFEGESEKRTGVYIEVHKDSSTEPTHKLPAEAGFAKESKAW
ncbi:MAG: palindromic element RPE1 domain-containing protein [Proteobacteria bacterium]|nr:palindromic element RPE1 domain-containing protein [Pseudomonadota bacterium]